jgi:serine/threonine-protein kinase
MTEANLKHQTLGRYQLLVPIARGGMGQVWLGRLQGARGFNKLVAVKTLLPSEDDKARMEAMLQEEARIASLVQHANVVHTLELGEHEGLLYLVMEWVDGEPLGFLLERASSRGGMPHGVAAALISQVLAGLHAAHELSDHTGPLGVVHRDVSPHNILVTYDGVAKLLDFGVAKATRQSSGNTETGEVKGKFSYMAPEQILGDEVDRRADVFAAGIVLYLLTTGKHPFKHANTAAVIHSITTDDPVAPPSSFVEDYPHELERVVLKALEKNAAHRYASAEDMRLALEDAVPQGFDDVGRSELRSFMQQTVGDRKTARREAVRRAQLAADARDVETGSRRALQNQTAQSASSLRAISISQPAPDGEQQLAAAPNGELEPLRRLEARQRHSKAPWVAAAAGVVLAISVTLPRFWPHEAGHAAASGAPRAGAPLSAKAAAAPPPAPVEAAAKAAPKEAEPAAPSVSAAPSAKPAPAPARKAAAPAKTKPAVRGDKLPGPSRDELMRPDY